MKDPKTREKICKKLNELDDLCYQEYHNTAAAWGRETGRTPNKWLWARDYLRNDVEKHGVMLWYDKNPQGKAAWDFMPDEEVKKLN